MESLNRPDAPAPHRKNPEEPNQAVFTEDGRRRLCFGRYLAMRRVDHNFLREKAEEIHDAEDIQNVIGGRFAVTRVVDTEPQVALRVGNVPGDSVVKKEQKKDIELYRQLVHDNIARLLAVLPSDRIGGLVEVFPLYDSDLLARMKEESYQLKDIHCWMLQVCDALAYLQGQNIVHSDLKPENILLKMIKGEHKVALTDFGWADKVGTRLLSAVSNSAPEVSSFWWRGSYSLFFTKVDVSQLSQDNLRQCANDVWSLGFTMRLLVSCFERKGKEYETIGNFLKERSPDTSDEASVDSIEAVINNLVSWTSKNRDGIYCQLADTAEDRAAMRMLLVLTQRMLAVDPAKRPVIQEVEDGLQAIPVPFGTVTKISPKKAPETP